MEAPRTAHWIEEHLIGPSQITIRFQYWLRLAPPAVAWVSDHGTHDVIDENGHRHCIITGNDRECMEMPLDRRWAQEDFLSEVLPWGWFNSERSAGGAPEWEWDPIGDRPALRHERSYPEDRWHVHFRACHWWKRGTVGQFGFQACRS